MLYPYAVSHSIHNGEKRKGLHTTIKMTPADFEELTSGCRPATSDNSCKVHKVERDPVAKTQFCVKSSSLLSNSISGFQSREVLVEPDEHSTGWRRLSNAVYASELANDEVRYQVGKGMSNGFGGEFMFRLEEFSALLRKWDRDLRTINFDCKYDSVSQQVLI